MHECSTTHRLLLVAHGTASLVGGATTRSLVAHVRAARPGVRVALCFLDVVDPRLADALTDEPTVVVPLLLSTGYHVLSDIPDAVADRPRTTVARHLGPDAALVDVLVDRLPVGGDGAVTVLVAAGSSRSEARQEVDETAAQLAGRVGGHVDVLTMADDLATGLRKRSGPLRVATYLLAEGRFTDDLARAAAGVADVAAPLGVHPALVGLIWSRFDEALASSPDDGDRGSRRPPVR